MGGGFGAHISKPSPTNTIVSDVYSLLAIFDNFSSSKVGIRLLHARRGFLFLRKVGIRLLHARRGFFFLRKVGFCIVHARRGLFFLRKVGFRIAHARRGLLSGPGATTAAATAAAEEFPPPASSPPIPSRPGITYPVRATPHSD